ALLSQPSPGQPASGAGSQAPPQGASTPAASPPAASPPVAPAPAAPATEPAPAVRPATPGDLAAALMAHPAVASALRNLQSQVTSHLGGGPALSGTARSAVFSALA